MQPHRPLLRIFALAMGPYLLALGFFGQRAMAESSPHTVSLHQNSLGVGFGLSWGSGTLHLGDGREVPFRLQGYRVLDLGVLQLRPGGTVENLEDPSDFEGQFSAAGSAVALGLGAAAVRLENENGVVLRLSGGARGLGLVLGAEGLHVTLGEIPELPEPPPVAAPPPVVPVAAAAPDPCQETLVLGLLHFDDDSAEVGPESTQEVGRAAERLLECPDERVRIDGYTDATGSPEYNALLSKRRAEAVKALLVDEGVSEDRLTTRGFGATDPIGSNETPEGRANNRRVALRPLR
jgi:outer membrane protein OmpA-like peptidoglycan-associated protein